MVRLGTLATAPPRAAVEQPLCQMCAAAGKTTLATIVDHIQAHKGVWELFAYGELQSLCGPCHSGRKQHFEATGHDRGPDFSCACDVNGWPLDPMHPSNVRMREEQAKKRSKQGF